MLSLLGCNDGPSPTHESAILDLGASQRDDADLDAHVDAADTVMRFDAQLERLDALRPAPDAASRPQCSNQLDDDDDGVFDLADPGCTDPDDDDENDPAAPPVCADSLDNDDDGVVDYPADPECVAAGGMSEGALCGADVMVARVDQTGGRVRLLLDVDGPSTRAGCGTGQGRGAVVQVTLTEPSVVRLVADAGPSPGRLLIHGRGRCRLAPTEFACVTGDRDAVLLSPVLAPGVVFFHVQWRGEALGGDPVDVDVSVVSVLRQCNDGLDNDGDGAIDVADVGCSADGDDDETTPQILPECADGVDNDRDGDVDWPQDVGCGAAGAPREGSACPPSLETELAGMGQNRFQFELTGAEQGTTQGRCGGLGAEAIVVIDVSTPSRLTIRVRTAQTGTVSAYLRAECGRPESEVWCDAARADRQFTVARAEVGQYALFLDHDVPFSAERVAVDVEVAIEPLERRACEDGIDNDDDGHVDRADPGCMADTDDDELDPPGDPPLCADGQDNDGDGRADWPDDPACARASGHTETDGCRQGDEMIHLGSSGGRIAFTPNRLSPGIARATCGGDLGGERIFALNLPEASHVIAFIEEGDAFDQTRVFARTRCLSPETERGCAADRLEMRNVPPGPLYVFTELGQRLREGPPPTMVVEVYPVERACNDQVDNDQDGRVDLADPGCADSLGLDEVDPQDAPECADGVDNDNDGDVDWPADSSCVAAGGSDEASPLCPGVAQLFELEDQGGRFMVDVLGQPDGHRGQCGGGTGESAIRLVLGAPARVVVETHGQGFDTVLYARANCGPDPAGELGCDDDGGDGHLSRLVLDLLPGTWFLFVDGFAGEGGRTDVSVDVVGGEAQQ